MNFTVISFETANYYKNSACSLYIIKVKKNLILTEKSFLIKPPTKWFPFSSIHGIAYQLVKDKPNFGELWPEIIGYFRGIGVIVCQNLSFDKSVFESCCKHYEIKFPDKDFCSIAELFEVLNKIHLFPYLEKQLRIWDVKRTANHHIIIS